MCAQVGIREKTVEVDGVRVHVTVAGRGPALVLVHGLVGSARNWEMNLAALAQARTVYALDLVNMGQSERVAGIDPRLEATADRIVRCMDALGVDRADIAGHSHGGAVVMMLAARHPERVEKLVLFAPANPYCGAGKSLIRFYTTRTGRAFARMIPRLPRVVHDVAHRRMYGDRRRVSKSALDGYTDGLNRESVEHILGIVGSWWNDMARLESMLTRIAGRPVLLIWGDRDGAVRVGSGERLAKALGARLMVLPGVGHLPFAEMPDVCNRVVGEWLLAS